MSPVTGRTAVFDGFSGRRLWAASVAPQISKIVPIPLSFNASLNQSASYPHIGQAAEQRPCPDVVADLTGGDEQVERASLAITNRVQLGVHPALCATDQASTPPFLTPMLVAVRWAFR